MISLLKRSPTATVVFTGIGWLIVLLIYNGQINISRLFGF